MDEVFIDDGRALSMEIRAYAALSLTARLAVGLHCFTKYCTARNLRSRELDEFLDYLWQWPTIATPGQFVPWESSKTSLVHFGLGGELSEEMRAALSRASVSEDDFRTLVSAIVEILWGSFFGAADDEGSLAYLASIIAISARCQVAPPRASTFASSRMADHGGWGIPLTQEQCGLWRQAQ